MPETRNFLSNERTRAFAYRSRRIRVTRLGENSIAPSSYPEISKRDQSSQLEERTGFTAIRIQTKVCSVSIHNYASNSTCRRISLIFPRSVASYFSPVTKTNLLIILNEKDKIPITVPPFPRSGLVDQVKATPSWPVSRDTLKIARITRDLFNWPSPEVFISLRPGSRKGSQFLVPVEAFAGNVVARYLFSSIYIYPGDNRAGNMKDRNVSRDSRYGYRDTLISIARLVKPRVW